MAATMRAWLQSLRRAVHRELQVPDALWADTLRDYPFLQQAREADAARLRSLSAEFLAQKEFHGAGGLQITDAMALAIAAQASLPVLHIRAPFEGLQWYRDFSGIVVHPAAMVAQREAVDDIGVVHRYDEVLSGEAMAEGPVTLSWEDVAASGQTAEQGYNVVVHEFAHKLDMRNGEADGCPPLPRGFLQMAPAVAQRHWRDTLHSAFDAFCDQLSIAERFGGNAPWLDPYAAQSIDEFFAVACEAYFVNLPAFTRELSTLRPLFDAFFRPPASAG